MLRLVVVLLGMVHCLPLILGGLKTLNTIDEARYNPLAMPTPLAGLLGETTFHAVEHLDSSERLGRPGGARITPRIMILERKERISV